MTLTGIITPGQSGPGSNSNERVLHIPQSSRIGALLSDSLMSHAGHLSWWRVLPSAEKQLVYSTVPADKAVNVK